MLRITASMVREKFAETVNRVVYRGERIVLQRHGKPVAAIVPVEDLEFLEALEDRMDLEEARKAMREAKGKPTIPWSRLKKQLGL